MISQRLQHIMMLYPMLIVRRSHHTIAAGSIDGNSGYFLTRQTNPFFLPMTVILASQAGHTVSGIEFPIPAAKAAFLIF
jgi:hypothetical protein